MISIEQINGEISTLEDQTPTHAVMQKLANLYTVRDHMMIGHAITPTVSLPSEEIQTEDTNSDFLKAIQDKDYADVLEVIDELMTVLLSTNTRLYDAVMRRF